MRIVRKLLTLTVILWGLSALTGRLLLPFVGDYRDSLASELGRQLGTPVTIGELSARWYHFTPLLELDRVAIGEGGDRFQVERASIEFSLPTLLRAAPLDAARITLDGMQLTLVREPSGQLHLEGFGSLSAQAGDGPTPPLPRHLRLVNTRVTWIDRKTGRPPLHIDDIDVLLDRDGEDLALGASLDTGSGRATLSANVEGFLATTRWRGDTYLKVDGLDVARLFAPYLPARYGLRAFDLDLESWGRWEDAAPVHHQGDFEIRGLDIHPTGEGAVPLRIERAAAAYSVDRPAEGTLRGGLKGLSLTVGGHHWPAGDLALALTPRPQGGTRLDTAADYLHIADTLQILQVRQPLPALEEPLRRHRPRGEVRDLRLQADLGDDTLEWRGRASVHGLTTDPWDDVPGVENLDGTLLGTHDHLALQLDGRQAALRFDGLFREPLAFDRLNGRVDLFREGEGWRLRSDLIEADTPHIRTRTRFALEQPAGQPLFLDLQTDFHDGDAAFAKRYYPVAIMGPPLVRWLDRSIISGRVESGTVLLHGPLQDYAFEKTRSGIFQAFFDTRDVLLEYKPGWPALEELDARVKFHGNQLDVEVADARIYDSRVVDTRAHIGSLQPSGPLHVRGELLGPLANNLRVLGEDALKDRFGEIAAAFRGAGQTRLSLDFTVPLRQRDQDAYALDGRLHLDGATLALPDWDFEMSRVSGRLDFTLDGLSAEGIRAHALGAPIRVDVTSLADGSTRVRTHGHFGLDAIRAQVQAVPAGLAEGASDFVVDIEVPSARAPEGTPTVLVVDSTLAGTRVALPAPLGKDRTGERAFHLRLPLTQRTSDGVLRYGDDLAATFSGDGRRVDILLGGTRAKATSRPGIHVRGRVPALDLLDWQAAVARLAPDDGASPSALDVDLQIGRLRVDEIGVDELHLTAGVNADGWQGRVESADLAGRFTVPGAQRHEPVRVILDRLNLRLPVDGDPAKDPPVPDPADGFDPTGLPGIVLSIGQLQLNEARLGHLQLNADPGEQGLRITTLGLTGGALELDGAGHWVRSGGRIETRLGGRLSTDDLGDLLVSLGYSRQIEDAPGSIEFLLEWPGDPSQQHRTTLTGKLSLDIGEGRLVELDPGVTRVVGLLNLNALTRRLRLDFSDFYKKGYSFDSIKGDFLFADATASTDNLTVLGPTGRISLKGTADLVARSLNQHVTVVPNLDATLPIAGTLAGGPIAGIAVLVAQQVITKDIDRINRFEYRLSGPWVDPEVHQLDTGGTLSKILAPLGDDAQGEADAGATPPDSTAGDTEDTSAVQPSAPAGAPATPPGDTRAANPLNGLIEVLKKGEAHGADLPGSQN